MKFERENTKAILNPTAKEIARSLGQLKGSKRSFAILSGDNENYLQMAGGGFNCLIEKNILGKTYRGYQDTPIVPWSETSILVTSCGDFNMEPNEYFNLNQIIDLFTKFLNGDSKLITINWRPLQL